MAGGMVMVIAVQRNRSGSAKAVTLIEVMVSMVILAIAAVGALGYQYYAAKQSKIAAAQTAAIRTAQLFLEDWKSTGGSSAYNPANLGLGFIAHSLPYEFTQSQWTALGTVLNNSAYTISIDSVPMETVLFWRNVDYDNSAGITLRQLTVVVRGIYEEGADRSFTPTSMTVTSGLTEPIILTTYVRLDAASG
jgi:prepilin-type N-terminal cleavage/methylation domain-containing protein